MKIKIKKLREDAIVPTQGTPGSNGYDFYSVEDRILLKPGQRYMVPTGIAIELPPGYTGLLCPRSGNAIKRGLTVINSPGIIDSDYRKEVNGLMINHSAEDIIIEKGEKIVQIVIVKALEVEKFEVVDELSKTQREGGLGSTGK